jgi:hypothetical protein
MQDINANQQSDYLDALGMIQKSDEFQQTASLEQDKQSAKATEHRDKMAIEQQKLNAQMSIADKQLEIARTNKNKYDSGTKKPKEKDKK